MEGFIEDLLGHIVNQSGLDANELKFGSYAKLDEAGNVMVDASNHIITTNGNVFELVNKIWGYFAIVGIGLTLIYFLIEINQKLALEGRDMNLKTFFAPFLKLVIAILVLMNGATLVSYALTLNDVIVEEVDNLVAGWTGEMSTGLDNDGILALAAVFTSGGFIIVVLIVFLLLLCWLITTVVNLVWWFKAITFKIEMFFRVAVTPVALADIYSGQNSGAIKWLKGFLAFTIYGVSMIVLPKIAAVLAMGDLLIKDVNVFEAIFCLLKLTIAPFAAISCMGAAKQMAKEALGS